MRYDGSKLGAVLAHQGRSRRWLGRHLGISGSYVQKMVTNDRPISDAYAARMAELLGVPLSLLEADERALVESEAD